MTRTRILITAPYTPRELDEIGEEAEVHYAPWTDLGRPRIDEELADLAREHGANVVIVELDEVGIKTLSTPGLEVVGCCRTSIPNIDEAKATELGIPILRTPGRNAQAVAEWVLAATLTTLRNLAEGERFLRANQWRAEAGRGDRPYLKFRGSELAGRTVSLIGFGAVSKRLAPVLTALGCAVLAVDPLLAPGHAPKGVEVVDLAEAASRADVFSIHLPVNRQTTGLIDHAVLSRLPRGAVVINSSRSAVVDLDALLALLEDGQVAGAALDVFPTEPPSEEFIAQWMRPNVLLTPHLAGATRDVEMHHSQIMNQALRAFQQGEPLPGTLVGA